MNEKGLILSGRIADQKGNRDRNGKVRGTGASGV
jgi:hypothetical protein